MRSRMDLHRDLVGIMDSPNKGHVYFQPPDGTKIQYPAIIYNLENLHRRFADDKPYIKHDAYLVTIIDKDPESEIVKRLNEWTMVSFDRFYAKDNLNHWAFLVYN